MRLNQILREFLGTKKYAAPQSAQTMMADFYMVQMLQQPDVHFPSHLRDEQEYELKRVEAALLPKLREHLLSAAGVSIFSEMKHFLDDNSRAGTGDIPNSEQLRAKLKIIKALLPKHVVLAIMDQHTKPDWCTLPEYQMVAEAGLQIFGGEAGGITIRWHHMYGGPAWARACQAWLKLYAASTPGDITLVCDRIYDLQHNSGQLLDKNQEYEGEWVTKLLDIKFAYKNPEPLLPYVSPLVKQLAQSYMRYFKKYASTEEQLGPLHELLAQLDMQIKPLGRMPGSFSIRHQIPGWGDDYSILCILTPLPHGLIKLSPYVEIDTEDYTPIPPSRFPVVDLSGIRDYLVALRKESIKFWTKQEEDNGAEPDMNDYINNHPG